MDDKSRIRKDYQINAMAERLIFERMKKKQQEAPQPIKYYLECPECHGQAEVISDSMLHSAQTVRCEHCGYEGYG